ncbi:MAG: hypothetical protein ACOC93_06645, partial [Planctomycetota bacterium]
MNAEQARIVVAATSRLDPEDRRRLAEFDGQIELREVHDDRQQLARNADHVQVVFGALRPEEVDALPSLQWMHVPWTGVTGILNEA